MTGLWVVFEDIDKAPPEVLSILLPLLEGASSFATGRGEVMFVLYSIVSMRCYVIFFLYIFIFPILLDYF